MRTCLCSGTVFFKTSVISDCQNHPLVQQGLFRTASVFRFPIIVSVHSDFLWFRKLGWVPTPSVIELPFGMAATERLYRLVTKFCCALELLCLFGNHVGKVLSLKNKKGKVLSQAKKEKRGNHSKCFLHIAFGATSGLCSVLLSACFSFVYANYPIADVFVILFCLLTYWISLRTSHFESPKQ